MDASKRLKSKANARIFTETFFEMQEKVLSLRSFINIKVEWKPRQIK